MLEQRNAVHPSIGMGSLAASIINNQPPAQRNPAENVDSLIVELGGISHEIANTSAQIAECICGPKPTGNSAEKPDQGHIIGALTAIRMVLLFVAEENRRSLNALGK